MKKKSIMLILLLSIVGATIGIGFMTQNRAADDVMVDIQYRYPRKNLNTTITTPIEEGDNSLLLLNWGADEIATWDIDFNMNGNYESETGTQTASYEASFAGWKMVSINGKPVPGNKEWIYPDNDYIYFDDEPFTLVGETITDIQLEAQFGKTVYVRDKYNFKDITDVFGYKDDDSVGDIYTSKIDWDESTIYGKDTNSGATSAEPVETLEKAFQLLAGENSGGKICIVNHLTIKATDNYYPYSSSYTSNNSNQTYTKNLGQGLNITGLVTITGENLGQGTAIENKTGEGNYYQNSHIYFLNNRGTGTFLNSSNKKVAYGSLSIYVRFWANTVLEGLNIMHHQGGVYNSIKTYSTGSCYFWGTKNRRLVVENTIKGYYRNSTIARYGVDVQNWSHKVAKEYEEKNGSMVEIDSYSAITPNFSSYMNFYGCANSYSATYQNSSGKSSTASETLTTNDNVYLTVKAPYCYYTYALSASNTKVNNIHMNLENGTYQYWYPVVSSTATANVITAKTYEVTSTRGGMHSGVNVTCQKALFVLKGNGTRKITNFYGGGYRNAVTETVCKTQGNFYYTIDGAFIGSFYAGGNQVATLVTGDIHVNMKSGKVTNLYGGGEGGFIGTKENKSAIDITINGGTIDYLYGGGSGGYVLVYSYSGGGVNATDYTKSGQYFYNGTNKYYITRRATYVNTNTRYDDATIWMGQQVVKDGTTTIDTYNTLVWEYVFPNTSDTSYTNYLRYRYIYAISDATVNADITINLQNGATINNGVYGGGKNGAVCGNIVMNIENAKKLPTDIYAGGEGTSSNILMTIISQNFKWTNKLEDHVLTQEKIEAAASESGSIFANAPAAGNYTQKFLTKTEMKQRYMQSDNSIYLYSPTISKLGLIDGNTVVNVNGGNHTNIYGGSNGVVASVSGKATVNVNGGTVANIYGGGKAGAVGSTSLNMKGGKVTSAYGGGMKAPVNGTTAIHMENGEITTLFGGGKEGQVESTSMVFDGGKITGVAYGGGESAAVNGNTSVVVNSGIIENIYAGGKAGEVEETEMVFNGGTINNSVYGGGKAAAVNGNTQIMIENGTIHSLYAGGEEGKVNNTTVVFNGGTISDAVFGGGKLADINGNATITVNKGSISELYGGGSEGSVDGNISIDVLGGSITTLYGGCNSADVTGTIDLRLNGGTVTTAFGGNNLSGITAKDITITVGNGTGKTAVNTLYGGGNQASHEKDVKIIVNDTNGTLNTLYGGGKGNTATVKGSTDVMIHKGIFTNIYAGGEEAVVNGNTKLVVGNKATNEVVRATNEVYGGGRGSSDPNADASNITTVRGNAEVTIAGMNTLINNYGSSRLGKVEGTVNVTFDTYRRENSTNPYVTMNGIDRATTVKLVESFISLENIGANGEKEGIKNIHNLEVPARSGLKVTASGKITGDFIGGGYFYLDSDVCLTVEGNIVGTTELVINPEVRVGGSEEESPLVIKGSSSNPYLKVRGNSMESNINCSDTRYKDMMRYHKFTESGVEYGYYYLELDIDIAQQIHQNIVSKNRREYAGSTETWGSVANVLVPQDGIFSTNIDVSYTIAANHSDTTSYRNIERFLVLKDSAMGGEVKSFPIGARITMVTGGEKYSYVVKSTQNEIAFSDFTEKEDESIHYVDIHDIIVDPGTIPTPSGKVYERNENFRFIVDMSNCSLDDFIPVKTYLVYLNIKDDRVPFEPDMISNNIIDIRKPRTIEVKATTTGNRFLENSQIPMNFEINITDFENYFEDAEAYPSIDIPLYTRVSIQNHAGVAVKLPTGATIRLGDSVTGLESGVARFELIGNITQDAYAENRTGLVDLSTSPEYSIRAGKYTIVIENYLQNNNNEKILSRSEFALNLVRPEGATVEARMETTTVEANSSPSIALKYHGDVDNPYVAIKLQRVVGEGNYADTTYAIVEENITDLMEGATKNITLNLSGVPVGKYAVKMEVYGFEDVLYSTSLLPIEIK